MGTFPDAYVDRADASRSGASEHAALVDRGASAGPEHDSTFEPIGVTASRRRRQSDQSDPAVRARGLALTKAGVDACARRSGPTLLCGPLQAPVPAAAPPRQPSAVPAHSRDLAEDVHERGATRARRRRVPPATPVTAPPGLATALERLGTETAFSVLARAKALERSGRSIVHLEIGEPDFDTAPHIVDAAVAAMRDGMTHYCPAAGLDDFRESIARYFSRTRGVGRRRGELPRRHGREAVPLLHRARVLQPRRRGDLSRPGLPDLRVGDSLGRRGAGPAGAARGGELLARPRTARGRCSRRARSWSSSTTRRTRRAARSTALPSRRSPRCSRRRRPGSSPTRSTRSCSTTTPSRASRASARCSSARSCSTDCRRPTP